MPIHTIDQSRALGGLLWGSCRKVLVVSKSQDPNTDAKIHWMKEILHDLIPTSLPELLVFWYIIKVLTCKIYSINSSKDLTRTLKTQEMDHEFTAILE